MSPLHRLRLIQCSLAGMALALLVLGLQPYAFPNDLVQDYLSARALRDGLDIFTPLDQLAARYFPQPVTQAIHANYHPPVLTALTLPMSFLPFELWDSIWLVVNMLLLLLIGRWLGLSISGSLALAAWPPLLWVLLLAQYDVLMLALVLAGWRAAASGNHWRAGMWLGLAASIKLYPLFFLLSFVVRRQFRVVLAAAAVFVVGQMGSLATVGPARFVHYYVEVLPAATAPEFLMAVNSSPYAFLHRFFGGASQHFEPIVNAPGLAAPLGIAVAALALISLLRLSPEAAPIAVFVASPVVWSYQIVLGLPQIVALFRSHAPRLAVILSATAASFALLILLPIERGAGPEPIVASLRAGIQPLGYIGLLILSVWVTRRRDADVRLART